MATAAKNNGRGTAVALWQPKELTAKMTGYIPQIDELLPDQQRGQSDRFVKRAMLEVTTGNQSAQLRKCSPDSIITAVIKAAELGIPIDGKLGYLVPFWNKHKGCMEAQFMASYLGLIMVAKRSGQVKDAFVDMVCQNDHFVHGRKGAQCTLDHTWDLGKPRGEQLAAYCVVTFPDGTWSYEIMEMEELAAIRRRSKAADSGPWVTDTEQMYLKTILRRALKRYCSDPGFVMAVQHDESEFVHATKRVTQTSLQDILPQRVQQPAISHEETEADEFNDDPMPEVEAVQDILAQLEQAVIDGDVALIARLDNEHCGPDSELTDMQMSIVAAEIKRANASVGKPKSSGELFEKQENTGA